MKLLNIEQISTGFIEVPGKISLNIYVQGCKKNCPNCQNPSQQSFDTKKIINADDLTSILSIYPLCDTVCWLGGDAVYQPEAFILFNKEFKKKGLKICLYTGMKIEEIKGLLDDVDIVIDGEWTGIPVTQEGTNQRIFMKDQDGEWKQIPDWKTFELILNFSKTVI